MSPEQVKTGMRVNVGRFGAGTVIDVYWRDRDRFKVRLDNGKELDFGSYSLTPLPPTRAQGESS